MMERQCRGCVNVCVPFARESTNKKSHREIFVPRGDAMTIAEDPSPYQGPGCASGVAAAGASGAGACGGEAFTGGAACGSGTFAAGAATSNAAGAEIFGD